jgi:ankyrin repeat protein
LHIAVSNAHYELASFLLDAGADPNASGPGYTALHVIPSVRKPGGGDNDPAPDGSGTMTSLELVKKLVAKGANIDARMTRKVNFGLTALNTAGATRFCLAARSADAELMRFLAALGADPKIPTADGATPLIVAAGLGTRSLAKMPEPTAKWWRRGSGDRSGQRSERRRQEWRDSDARGRV